MAIGNCADTAQVYSKISVSFWSCQSLYPLKVNLMQFSPNQVGVYAVFKCPSTWLKRSQELGLSMEEFQFVQDACDAANSSLPLASDAASGQVYKNEYCALCHGGSQMAFWHHNMVCSSELLGIVRGQTPLSLDAISEFCGSCSYMSPPAIYSSGPRDLPQQPRSCTPAISSCLTFSEFSTMEVNLKLSIEEYQQIVDNCTHLTNYVQTFSSVYAEDVVFKNPYCIRCNNILSIIDPICFSFDPLSFPVCKATTGAQVEIVVDAALGTLQIFNLSRSSSALILGDVTIDVQCAVGQIFDFVNRKCRNVSCFQFNLPISELPCTIVGYSTDINQTSGCSKELVLDNHILLFPLNDTTFYYLPLLSIVFVSYFNNLGLPVACLDSSVPSQLPILKLLRVVNTLTYVTVVLSIVVFSFIIFLYTVPRSMRSVFGVVVASFATASLLADFALLLGYPVVFVSGNQHLCIAAGILEHFFGLSQFFWLTVHVFDIGLRYYRRALVLPPCNNVKVLLPYFCAGWGLPATFTAFEVAIAFGTGNMGSYASCFQISSFWNAFPFYILSSTVAVAVSWLAFVLFLILINKTTFKFSGKDKSRFPTLFVLLILMSVLLLVKITGLSLTSKFDDVVVGFFRLLMVTLISAYSAVVFMVKKKVPKALLGLCGWSNNQVRPMAAGKIEDDKNLSVGERERETQLKQEQDLEKLAEQLEDPSLYLQ